MGKENEFIITDMLGKVGHLFNAPRTTVATSRFKLSEEFIGNVSKLLDSRSNVVRVLEIILQDLLRTRRR
jgi:hypothetical protein